MDRPSHASAGQGSTKENPREYAPLVTVSVIGDEIGAPHGTLRFMPARSINRRVASHKWLWAKELVVEDLGKYR